MFCRESLLSPHKSHDSSALYSPRTPTDSMKVLTGGGYLCTYLNFCTAKKIKRNRWLSQCGSSLATLLLYQHVQLGNKKDRESISPAVVQMKQTGEVINEKTPNKRHFGRRGPQNVSFSCVFAPFDPLQLPMLARGTLASLSY